jgi:DNA-binding XRE family transcriptional regulator
MPRQNTRPAAHPQAVLQSIEQLARHIVIARKRRGETQAQWAQKLGVSQPTMARIERGDPAVAMVSYVMCMWLINPHNALAELIAPLADHAALEREVRQLSPARRSRQAPKAPQSPPPFRAGRADALPAVAALTAREPQPPGHLAGPHPARAGAGAAGAPQPPVAAAGLAALLAASAPKLP